jgi:hypothetical protein
VGDTSGIWVADQLVRARHEELLARSKASFAARGRRRAWRCPLRAAAGALQGCRRPRAATTAGRLTGGLA